ncbi:hypothetical protein [Georgenia thermotolerans]|uniref:Uncharacterized protein n=1 Tax=Georgenia thermotolerans TaxID=527326 RepID=A0A7J5UT92_9MICO|nr:hypothetical protein [Georgenia thermotolerans]KAE8765303.1 hypothetical protein GB883_04470 [Georgenia thermotolerans]
MSTPSPDEAIGMANDPYIDEREHAKAGNEAAEPTEDATGGEETGSASGR